MRRWWVALAAVALALAVGLVALPHWRRAQSAIPLAPAQSNQLPSLVGLAGPFPKTGEYTAPLPTGTSEVITLDDAGRVSRRTNTGGVRWSVPLDGHTGGVRPPHLLADADRVYVTHTDGVTALDAAGGAVLWHASGSAERMLLSGDLLLAAECGIGESITKNGRWVVARNVTTGREAFHVRLPTEEFDPLPIEDAAGLFLVQQVDRPGGAGLAILFDRTGVEHHRLARQVIAVRSWAGARLVMTGRDVLRLSAAGVVEWTTPFQEYEWLAGGGLVPLPGGGMVAFLYCQIADSGVRIHLLDPVRGGKAWEVTCPGLGVTHSGYNHAAIVEPVRNHLRVISRGDGGVFVEVLDIGTGRSVRREATRP